MAVMIGFDKMLNLDLPLESYFSAFCLRRFASARVIYDFLYPDHS